MSLVPASGLRRFLSNWARLSLLLLNGHLPWWTWRDSGRFSHYSKVAYPYGWARRASAHSIDFDCTLGFPGEGPISLEFPRLDSDLHCLSSCVRFGFRPCRFFFFVCCFEILTFFRLVDAMPLRDTTGVLQPRDRGDIRRASDRFGLLLTEGLSNLAQRIIVMHYWRSSEAGSGRMVSLFQVTSRFLTLTSTRSTACWRDTAESFLEQEGPTITMPKP